MSEKEIITVQVLVDASLTKTWDAFTLAKHIVHWNFAADTWHCPSALNDPTPGGKFVWRMEAKDGTVGFDFSGVYQEVRRPKFLSYVMDDGRKATVSFEAKGDQTQVVETFEAEVENPVDKQRDGWQGILENFKKHAESIA